MISLKKKKSTLPVRNALGWILFSTFIISGTAALAMLYTSHVLERQKNDPSFNIVSLDLQGAIDPALIAELLELSADHPVNIHHFNSAEGVHKLLSYPLFKTATIKKELPAQLKIDYTLRIPRAIASDWLCAAWDQEGILMPIDSCFDQMELPAVVLGDIGQVEWGKSGQCNRLMLAFEILNEFHPQYNLTVDVSRAEEPSFGRREVIVTLPGAILRLNPEDWRQEIANYLQIKQSGFLKKMSVIDLRISCLGFVQEKPSF